MAVIRGERLKKIEQLIKYNSFVTCINLHEGLNEVWHLQ
jgi:hypothetical protein